jgi:hypothetical protein
MKRSSSSASKENPARGSINKLPYRPQRNNEQLKMACTQSLVPGQFPRDSHPWNTPLPDFYKTFTHNNFIEFSPDFSAHNEW